jgi:hypothetical protein
MTASTAMACGSCVRIISVRLSWRLSRQSEAHLLAPFRITPNAGQKSFCFSRVSTAKPAARRAGSTATIVSEGIVEQLTHCRKNGGSFQIRKLAARRAEHTDLRIGRRPDLRIRRTKQEKTTRSGRGRQMGNSAVMTDEHVASRENRAQQRKR